MRAVTLWLCLTLVPAGAAAQDFSALDREVTRGIGQGVYPGAVLIIGRRDTVLYARGYGHFTWDRASAVPTPEATLWDLASVSKVVATAASALVLVDRGQLDLDAPVGRYLPRFRGDRRPEVTVRMLLDHTSGLPSYREYFKQTTSRAGALELLYAEPLTRAPGASAVYSDLNAMLLGLVVEAVAGEPLDRFAQRAVFTPLGMAQTRYAPARELRPRIAPTGQWRGHAIAGEVNDQNAVVLGGVAGHAGVFSTGVDLARFARMWLAEGAVPGGGRLVRAETVRRFLQASPRSGSRLLGWDTRDPRAAVSVFGSLVSDRAYGHTGWTGTLLWIDPARDLFLVFLTNRSFAPRTGSSISALRSVRARLADATIRAVPGACRADVAPAC